MFIVDIVDGFYSSFLLSENQTRDNIIGLIGQILVAGWLIWGCRRWLAAKETSGRPPTKADEDRLARFFAAVLIAIIATLAISITYNLAAGAFTFLVLSVIAAALLSPAAFDLYGQPTLELTEDQIARD